MRNLSRQLLRVERSHGVQPRTTDIWGKTRINQQFGNSLYTLFMVIYGGFQGSWGYTPNHPRSGDPPFQETPIFLNDKTNDHGHEHVDKLMRNIRMATSKYQQIISVASHFGVVLHNPK